MAGKKPAQDVSKALFMDLAFLLIAALVLMVKDASQKNQEVVEKREAMLAAHVMKKLDAMDLRERSTASEVIEAAIPGESLFIELDKHDNLHEIPSKGDRISLQTTELAQRIRRMPEKHVRVIVLFIDKTTSYQAYSALRDQLTQLKKNGDCTRFIEVLGEPK